MYGYRDFEMDITGMTKEQVSEGIINCLTNKRVKHHKPSTIFFAGDSGEGKSMGMLRWGELIEPDLDMEKQIIYTPYEYPDKFSWLLYSKEAKHKHLLLFMEARELVKAKLWYTTINQAIADANAMSRTIKPIVLLVGSQDITDVDKPLRRTLTFYGFCLRPLQGRTNFHIYRVWKSRFNIDNPKLTLRKLVGTFVNGGNREKVQIQKMILNLPKEEIKKRFEELDLAAKTDIINKKMTALKAVLEKEKPKATHLEQIVEVMIRDPGILNMFIRRNQRDGSIILKSEFETIYHLDKKETQNFKKLLEERLRQVGVVSTPKEEERA
jgi:hypothetical protein